MAVAESGAESVSARTRVRPEALAGTDARRHLPVGVSGLVLVVGGTILQSVALLSTSWLTAGSGSTRVVLRYSDFSAQTQRGFAHIYFAWGAWLMLALTLAFGVAACIRWRGAPAFRLAGGVLGVLVFAYQTDVESFHIARNYAAGVYLAMLGCLATAFGAAAGEVGT